MPSRSAFRALLLGSLVVAGALAGCAVPSNLSGASQLPVDNVLSAVKLLDEGGYEMDVPLEVYLVGFDEATASALREKLKPETVDHSAASFDRAFPPSTDTMPLGGMSMRSPAQPRVLFDVVDMDAAFEARFLEAAKGWTVDGSESYDANAAEAWLATALAEARGAPLDRSSPVFVILHMGDVGEHAWRYTYSHGYLEPIRAFGEFEPLVAFDVSAMSDPYVVSDEPSLSPLGILFSVISEPAVAQPYDLPLEASGADTVKALAQLATDAAHYRFFKGPIYPIATKPCHHVTLLLAVHQTAMTEQLPGFQKAADYVDVAGLEGAFENLTGDEVTVELKTLALPVDDPALDALSRQAAAFVTLDALRWYLDENWDRFVTPAEQGCEEYLSMLLFSDPSGHTRQFGGIGTYDVKRSHRISFSIVTDVSRVQKTYDGPGADAISTKDETDAWNAVNLLYSHETGHLFGQHHPQHLSRTDAASPVNHAFESVYSVMSYQTGTRIIDFGAVDYATWNRARVGYTVAEAQALGLEETPEFQAALGHLALGHYAAAHLALEPLVQAESEKPEADGRLPDFHMWSSHAHPWG